MHEGPDVSTSIPCVSVLMPVWNAESYLPATISSLSGQTFSDFEVVCVLDGCTDQSCTVLSELQKKDARIRIVNVPHGGYAGALARCISVARGKYLMFLDNDDFFSPEAIEHAVSAIESSSRDVVFFDWVPVPLEDGSASPEFGLPSCGKVTPIDDIVQWSLVDRRGFVTRVLMGSKIYRREAVVRIADGIENTYADLVFYWRMFSRSGLTTAHLNEVLYYYRERTGSIIHSKLSPRKAADRAHTLFDIAESVRNNSPKAFPSVQRKLFPEIAWTAYKWANRGGDECLKAACSELLRALDKKLLRWTDFQLRHVRRAIRIWLALRRFQREEGL